MKDDGPILVTGATGFIGSAVARAARGQGLKVRALARPSRALAKLEATGCEIVLGDVRDRASVESAVKGAAAVIHLAADYRLWARHPGEIRSVNLEGTATLMDAALAAGVRRIVHTSSVATLRPGGSDDIVDETSPADEAEAVGAYKKSKIAAEKLVLQMVAERGLPAVIVNPSTPIGPGDVKPTPTGQIVLDAARGRTPAYVDTGLNIVHVDDVAAGHLLAFHRGHIGERYILGGEDMTLKQILTLIAQLVGRKPPRIRLPHGAVLPVAYFAELYARLTGRPTRVTVEGVRMARKRMFFSSAKAVRELGYRWRP
ncbi:MAG: hopanoid-associated sugar epimerase, partial [Caulobacteraceae bacterium]